jgi:hypothetical protein
VRRSKYGNRKVKYDGYTFDSLAERDRYIQLRFMEQEGEITALCVHPRYELIAAYEKNERKIRAAHYEADFEYRSNDDGTLIIEDVKGVQTAVFKLKRKLFESMYPHEITIIQV